MQRDRILSGSWPRGSPQGQNGRGSLLQRTPSSSTVGSVSERLLFPSPEPLISPFQQLSDDSDDVFNKVEHHHHYHHGGHPPHSHFAASPSRVPSEGLKEEPSGRILQHSAGSIRGLSSHHRRSSSAINLEPERSRASGLVLAQPSLLPVTSGIPVPGPAPPSPSPQQNRFLFSLYAVLGAVFFWSITFTIWAIFNTRQDAVKNELFLTTTTGGLGTYAGSTLLGASSFPYDGGGAGAIGTVAAGGQGDGFTRDGTIAQALVDKSMKRLKGLTTTIQAVHGPLGICIMTADFWGKKDAGGTATAYALLAQALADVPNFRVTVLGVSKFFEECAEGAHQAKNSRITWSCLEPHHFIPEVVETWPYEQLAHALLSWLEQHKESCHVLHIHEWGGIGVHIITVNHFRRLKEGLRIVVEAHGGHFWSTQGQLHRPLDITSLRIDHGERMSLQLADALISPTRYMRAFLKQRGWRLPREQLVIPNVIPHSDDTELAGEEKPIWRVAFFSRLEARKGLKLFVEAVSRLDPAKIPKNFEVYFVGAEAKLDMRSSSEWLKDKTVTWPFPTYIRVNTEREEALTVLKQEGMLVVIPSYVDNMPYVVAEAATSGIPFIVFDVGGVLEMLDPIQDAPIIIGRPELGGLTKKIEEVLVKGSIRTAVLNQAVKRGRDGWLEWHAIVERQRDKITHADKIFMIDTQKRSPDQVQLVHLKKGQPALELWEEACASHNMQYNPYAHRDRDVPLLLLPEEYDILEGIGDVARQLSALLVANTMLRNGVGALTFGVELPVGKHSYPSAPTWMLYTGDDTNCIENIPLLMRKDLFCNVYLAEARTFRTYYSWVMVKMLRQAGLRLHTYPKTVFKVKSYSLEGFSCMPDKAPTDRKLTFGATSNLFPDADEIMDNLHLAPFPRPAASLISDFPTVAGHMGWHIGYITSNRSSSFKPLYWHPAPKETRGAAEREGKWACAGNALSYPSMHHALIHPCVSASGDCCGDVRGSVVLRWQSFFSSPNAQLVLAFEVWPICGDGLDLEVVYRNVTTGKSKQLDWLPLGINSQDKPQRQKMEFTFDIEVGDVMDFIAHPRENQDCDGVYLVDIQYWKGDVALRTA